VADPGSTPAFRLVHRLLLGYFTLSVVNVAAITVMRHDPHLVTPTVWVRAVIVAVAAALSLWFAAAAAGGSRRGFLRLRIVSVIVTVAIVMIVALLGMLPLWMRLEQAACGLLMAPVAVLTNGRKLRQLFSAEATDVRHVRHVRHVAR
jgi:hypothetical protein